MPDAPVDFPPRRIYSVVGVPPEVQAYAMAKYSRSQQGMLESIQELSTQKAEEFLNTFYFQYGHRSIADLAHLVFGLEQISILAAIAVVDEQVWDGQERSTRYQPFRATGWAMPGELTDPALAKTFTQTAEGLFTAYEQLTEQLLERLQESVAKPEGMTGGNYRRTLRARAFDVARSLLPLATHTSVGQVVSARVLERQVSRMLSSPYAEIRRVAEELKAACQQRAESPLLSAIQDEELQDVVRPKAAPTLVKYAAASQYLAASEAALREAAAQYLAPAGEPDRSKSIQLNAAPSDPMVEIAATLLYRHDVAGHSYGQALQAAGDLSDAQRQEILDLSLKDRGRHDDLLREHQSGYALAFDVLIDYGSFRDLHRHRRCVQIQQPLTWSHGFDRTESVFEAGLGAEVAHNALEQGLGEVYAEALAKAESAAQRIAVQSKEAADYLMPLAYRTRTLFKMDWAQAVYMIEQRSTPAGHFSYRRAAWGMFEELRARHPGLAQQIRASNPYETVDLLQR